MTVAEAVHVLLYQEHLEDWAYDIRERVNSSEEGWEGVEVSWDHPRMKRFGEVIRALKAAYPKDDVA